LPFSIKKILIHEAGHTKKEEQTPSAQDLALLIEKESDCKVACGKHLFMKILVLQEISHLMSIVS
jgi:hypothetical protein